MGPRKYCYVIDGKGGNVVLSVFPLHCCPCTLTNGDFNGIFANLGLMVMPLRKGEGGGRSPAPVS